MKEQHKRLMITISKERLNMSEKNCQHFDIEARDHLKLLQQHPGELERVEKSLQHRIELHKTRNMFLVPPMLFPLVDEKESDHLKREQETWGLHSINLAADFGEQKSMTPEQHVDNSEKGTKENQEELFQWH